MILAKLLYLSRLFNLSLRSAVLAIAGTALALPCLALPDDRQQPISIESDYAERNEKTGRTVYRGNVVISQGSVLIAADEITLHVDNNKINRIECEGTPASYQQKPEIDGAIMIARANHIDYLPATNKLTLKQNAMLSRDGTIIKGDSIDYDINKQTWKAKGDNQGQQKRIQLVIPPSALQSSDTSSAEITP